MPLIKNEINQEISDDSDEESTEVETINSPVVTEPKKKSKTITSACGSNVIIKKRHSRSKPKPIIIYEEDLYTNDEPQEVIVKKKTRGRPKKAKPVIEYVNDKGESVDKDDSPEQIIINKPKKEKLSAKDIKMIELQEKILELETVSGKTIRGTKKGNIDKRQTKPPTEKQLAARKKFIENNKLRNEAKKKAKEEKSKISKKEDVKIVIDELQTLKKKSLEDKVTAQALKEKMKQEILEEQKSKATKSKPNNQYEDFM
jgi:hypothetical protein